MNDKNQLHRVGETGYMFNFPLKLPMGKERNNLKENFLGR